MYNNAWQESVQNPPFYPNHGRHPCTPLAISLDKKRSSSQKSTSPASAACPTHLQQIITRAQRCMLNAQQRQKHYYDNRHVRSVLKWAHKYCLPLQMFTCGPLVLASSYPDRLGPLQSQLALVQLHTDWNFHTTCSRCTMCSMSLSSSSTNLMGVLSHLHHLTLWMIVLSGL